MFKEKEFITTVNINVRENGSMKIQHPDDLGVALAILGTAVEILARKIERKDQRIQVVNRPLKAN